eukprot:SAG31_NODE_1292_length_8967_cov_2.998985_2_plen_183_part_00
MTHTHTHTHTSISASTVPETACDGGTDTSTHGLSRQRRGYIVSPASSAGHRRNNITGCTRLRGRKSRHLFMGPFSYLWLSRASLAHLRHLLTPAAQVLPTSHRFSVSSVHGDTFSISALHLAIKVPYFSNSGHKNEKVTSYLVQLGGGVFHFIFGRHCSVTLSRLAPGFLGAHVGDSAGKVP